MSAFLRHGLSAAFASLLLTSLGGAQQAAPAAPANAPAGTPAAPAASAGGAPNWRAIIAASTPKTYTNTIGMVFEPVPEGSFVMGRYEPACPVEHPAKPAPMGPPVYWKSADYAQCEVLAKKAYRPGFVAEVRRPFLMGKYEVTQAQFEQVMGRNPSRFKGPNQPVGNVTWDDAKAFIAKLNALEHTDAYRLPSEAEWEWAARAATEPTGPWVVFNLGNGEYGWFQPAGPTSDVGSKKPNAWGLYDTLGNVWEWVEDFYNQRYLADPVPPKSGSTHVIKGGSLLHDANMTFPTDHAGGPAAGFDVGFRVARAAE